MRFRYWIVLPLILFSQASVACILGGGHSYTRATFAEYIFFGEILQFELKKYLAVVKVRTGEKIVGSDIRPEEIIYIKETHPSNLNDVLSFGEYLFVVVTPRNKNMRDIRMYLYDENPDTKWLLAPPCDDHYLFKKDDPVIVDLLEVIRN